jgi:uncharacterized damage-inducible protein DinB
MVVEHLKAIFSRDLQRLSAEIELYTNEENLWKVSTGITNTAGNLCLHLVGNLNHFIGADIGQTGYIRQRDLEFSLKNVPKAVLLQKIEDTILVVNQSLDRLSDEDLKQALVTPKFDQFNNYSFMLIHLAAHLSYHLGQINYHRRMLDVAE